MAQDRYSIYSASLGSLNLVQLLDTQIELGAVFSETTPGGAVDRGAVMLSHADPKIMFRTGDLASVLAAVSLTTGLGVTTSEIRCQKRADPGVFASGSNHVTLGITKGFVAPTQIAAQQDDPGGAVISLDFWLLFDGTNNPITYAASQSISSDPAPAFTSKFFMGPVYVGATQIEGLQAAIFEPGLAISPKRADGLLYATASPIILRQPVFRLRFDKMTNVASVTSSQLLAGAALGDTLSMFLRKGAASSSRVADATEEHVEISAAAGHWHVNNARVEGERDYALEIVCRPIGTVSVSAAAAIP